MKKLDETFNVGSTTDLIDILKNNLITTSTINSDFPLVDYNNLHQISVIKLR